MGGLCGGTALRLVWWWSAGRRHLCFQLHSWSLVQPTPKPCKPAATRQSPSARTPRRAGLRSTRPEALGPPTEHPRSRLRRSRRLGGPRLERPAHRLLRRNDGAPVAARARAPHFPLASFSSSSASAASSFIASAAAAAVAVSTPTAAFFIFLPFSPDTVPGAALASSSSATAASSPSSSAAAAAASVTTTTDVFFFLLPFLPKAVGAVAVSSSASRFDLARVDVLVAAVVLAARLLVGGPPLSPFSVCCCSVAARQRQPLALSFGCSRGRLPAAPCVSMRPLASLEASENDFFGCRFHRSYLQKKRKVSLRVSVLFCLSSCAFLSVPTSCERVANLRLSSKTPRHSPAGDFFQFTVTPFENKPRLIARQ